MLTVSVENVKNYTTQQQQKCSRHWSLCQVGKIRRRWRNGAKAVDNFGVLHKNRRCGKFSPKLLTSFPQVINNWYGYMSATGLVVRKKGGGKCAGAGMKVQQLASSDCGRCRGDVPRVRASGA